MGYAPICPPKLRAEERTWVSYRIHAIFREIGMFNGRAGYFKTYNRPFA